FLDFRYKCVHETGVDRPHHVDPLDGATTLPRVVERAVHRVFDGKGEVGILAHERRVFTAQFEAHVQQTGGGPLVDLAPALYGTGEGNEIDRTRVDEPADHLMADMNRGEQTRW